MPIKIRPFEPTADADRVYEVLLAANEVAAVDELSTLEAVPSREQVAASLQQHGFVSELDNRVVGFASLRQWTEAEDTAVYLHTIVVDPKYRQHAVDSALLTHVQQYIREQAGGRHAATKVFAANASATETAAIALLEKNGYQKVWSMVEMEFTDLDNLKDISIPEGFGLRSVETDDDKRSVYKANRYVYNGTFGMSAESDADYQEFLSDNSDTKNWVVAWWGDEVAGFVISKPKGDLAEIMEVSVLPKFRRQGLAKFLMVTAMKRLHDQGVVTIRLHTNAAGDMGGRQLYENIGFKSLKEHYRYRKHFA